MDWQFRDRAEAGRRLAERLRAYAGEPDLIVLGLARGGVPVAFEVASALDAPLDAYLVRKLGAPGREELAMGAIVSGGARVINEDVVRALGIPDEAIDAEAAAELRQLERQEATYRAGRSAPDVAGRVVLLIDDGLATGTSMRAAAVAIRKQRPRRLIVAVPVAPREACRMLEAEADEVICLHTPQPFEAVGLWYADFDAVSDESMRDMLTRSRRTGAGEARGR